MMKGRGMTIIAGLLAVAVAGCGGRRVSVTSDDPPAPDSGAQVDPGGDDLDLLSFCRGPARVAFDDGSPSYPDTVTPRWTVVSGPASPEGGVVVSTRVWVQLFKASTWDWMNETGITVTADLQTPVRVDLSQLPSSWIVWIEHGLQRTFPDEEKPYSSARGHSFRGWFELHGSLEDGAELSICAVATRADGTTIKVHVPAVRFWLR
jgi:hypothetical protein